MLYFLIYLFLEVVVSVNIASSIGGINTFVEILLSAAVGIAILIGFRETLSANLEALARRQIDPGKFQELNMFTLVGALLLIMPGFLTDIVGILLQFRVFSSVLVNRFAAKFGTDKKYDTPYQTPKGDDNVIDVEIISDPGTRK